MMVETPYARAIYLFLRGGLVGRLPLLIGPEHQQRYIQSKEVVAFFLVVRELGSEDDWLVPTLEDFHDFMGHVESAVLVEWDEYANIIDWTNEWGQVGVMGLHSSNEQLMHNFRKLITTKQMAGMEFNTFPKEAMIKSPDITAVIKNNLRTFSAGRLPRALFTRNPELRGTLQVTHVKVYGAKDTARVLVRKGGGS